MISKIDPAKCTGCGTCFKSCGLDVFRLDTSGKEISPCMGECPAGNDIRTVNYLLQQSRIYEALAVLKTTMPFPAVTGRVCPHLCESKCSRRSADEAVNINAIEEFLGGFDLDDAAPSIVRRHLERVAVAGSGPAGLAAAWYLALAGYPVTVFEERNELGGMLRYGIPEYRLPVRILDGYLEKMRSIGVEFVTNTRIGRGESVSLKVLEERGFKALVLAIGASVGRELPVKNIIPNSPDLYNGVDFLAEARSAQAPDIAGKRVLVVGGGNVAVDVAITAVRLAASAVTIVCLEQRGDMPAFDREIEDAVRYGVTLVNGWGPDEIRYACGRINGLKCVRCTSLRDEDGRFAPVFNCAETLDLDADVIVGAIGQKVDASGFSDCVDLADNGCVIADPVSAATSCRTVFAAGDAVTGPASVVQAIRGGREAAYSVERMLQGMNIHLGRQEPRPVANMDAEAHVRSAPRHERTILPPGSEDSHVPFPVETVLAEAMRCLTCGSKAYICYADDCMTCFSCEVNCPSGAVTVDPFKEVLPRALPEGVFVHD